MDPEVVGLIGSLLSISVVVWRSVHSLVKVLNRLNDRVQSWDDTTRAMVEHVADHASQRGQLDRIEHAQQSGQLDRIERAMPDDNGPR